MNAYLGRLTFFRFIAAIIVVYFHFGQKVAPATYGILREIAASGPLAVSFFYCLSGFVLATVYDRDDSSAATFWIARFSRVYPVYLFCLVFGAMFAPFPAEALVLDIFLLQSWVPGYPSFINAPAWSLSVEALFYVAFPFMLRFFRQSSRARIVYFASLVWIASQFATSYLFKYHFHGFETPSRDAIFYFPLMHLNEFVMGAVGALLYKDWHESKYITLVSIIAFAGSVLTAFCLLSLGKLAGWSVPLQNGLLAPIFVSGMWLVASMPKAIGDILSSRPLVMLGEASYALYLLQVPLAYWLPPHMMGIYGVHPVLYFYSYLAMLIAAALAIYLAIAKPARKHLKVRLSRIALPLSQDAARERFN
jgi:peptidoglycan/LPS O-acetylase OafA/YrhL